MKFSGIQSPLTFHELQKLNVYKKLRSIKHLCYSEVLKLYTNSCFCNVLLLQKRLAHHTCKQYELAGDAIPKKY